MQLNTYRLQLPLKHPFTIARGTITTQPSLIVELEHNGVSGFGEVTENDFYGHSFADMEDSLEKASSLINRYADTLPEELWDSLVVAMEHDSFALSALDMAAHDLHGKLSGLPTWKRWGLTWQNVPSSSFTIGIAAIPEMIAKLQEEPDWPIYKIKLGTEHDLEIVAALREHTSAVFRVDANCAWDAKQTIDNSQKLAELGVEFIEQPLHPSRSESEKRECFAHSVLPIIADEDCQIPSDVKRCSGMFHGINVKICKCGGLTPALRMLREATELGLKRMVGCMVESAVGISGAAQLLPILDYADLDGAVLLREAPATGIDAHHGLSSPPTCHGNGGQLQFERLEEFSTS